MSSAAQNQSSRCDDSVLSIAANIAGVLTFAYALTAGLAFYYHSYVDSARQIRELLSYLRNSTFDIISPSSDFWSFRTIPSTIEGRQLRKIQKNTGTAAHKQVKNLEQLAHRSLKGHNQVLRFRGRGRFVLSRQKLMEERAAVEKSLQTFYSATIRYEKFAESLYREIQQQTVEEQRAMLNRGLLRLELLDSRVQSVEQRIHGAELHPDDSRNLDW